MARTENVDPIEDGQKLLKNGVRKLSAYCRQNGGKRTGIVTDGTKSGKYWSTV